MAELSHAERAALRERLVEERAQAALRLAHLTRELDAVVEAAALDAPDDEHDPEGSTVGFERAQVAALAERTRADLAELDRAIARLAADPGFGTCTRCGRAIGVERLRARPGTTVCVECAARGTQARRR